MKMKRSKKTLSLILCRVLIVAMAQLTTGCNGNSNNASLNVVESNTQKNDAQQADTQDGNGQEADVPEGDEVQSNAQSEGAVTEGDVSENDAEQADVQVVGDGSTVFPFTVTDKDGNETKFEVHTDKTVVGEALLELGLVEGEDGDYGLYVKTVNGITADYDKDGVYWAFYVNDEYAQAGVDVTDIKEGDSYAFKVE